MKFYLKNPDTRTTTESGPLPAESWLLLRASGTEPLLRIYAESGSPESVQALLEAGRNFAMGDAA
jgi:phosphomannomutase